MELKEVIVISRCFALVWLYCITLCCATKQAAIYATDVWLCMQAEYGKFEPKSRKFQHANAAALESPQGKMVCTTQHHGAMQW